MNIIYIDIIFLFFSSIIFLCMLFNIWILFFQNPLKFKSKNHAEYGELKARLWTSASEIPLCSGTSAKIEFYENVIVINRFFTKTIITRSNYNGLVPIKETKVFNISQIHELKIIGQCNLYIYLRQKYKEFVYKQFEIL